MSALEAAGERTRPLLHSRALEAALAWAPLSAVLAVAAVLRLQGFTRPFVGHHDWHAAFYSLLADGRCDCSYYNWPPLTEWMYRLSLWAFGPQEWGLRVIPVALSLGTVALVYALGERLFHRRAGLLAALLLALIPGDAYFARIASFHFFIPLTLYLYLLSTQGRHRGYLLAGAAGSLALGVGFSYSALPIVALPAGYIAWRSRDRRGYALLLLSGLAVVIAWWGYLLVLGELGKLFSRGLEMDGLGKWTDPRVRPMWTSMLRSVVYSDVGRTVVSLAAVGLVTWGSLRPHGTRVVALWAAAALGWLLLYPMHSSTHDMWWQVLYVPLALLAGRGLALVTEFRGVEQAPAPVRILTGGIAAAVLLGAGIGLVRDADAGMYRLLSIRDSQAEAQMGELLSRFAGQGDRVLAPDPVSIWYAGIRGQLYGRLYFERGVEGYEEVLRDGWATYVITHNARPLSNDTAAWSYTPPYYEGLLRQYGYVPALGLGDWLVLWAKPERARDIAEGLWSDHAKPPDVRLPLSPEGLSPFPDGTVTQAPGGKLYLIGWGGLKLSFPDQATLETYGFDLGDVKPAPQELLGRVPSGPRLPRLKEGMVVRGAAPSLYLIQQERKRLIPDMATFRSLGLDPYAVVAVPDEALGRIPSGTPLIRASPGEGE